jgi:hypothetical protein
MLRAVSNSPVHPSRAVSVDLLTTTAWFGLSGCACFLLAHVVGHLATAW